MLHRVLIHVFNSPSNLRKYMCEVDLRDLIFSSDLNLKKKTSHFKTFNETNTAAKFYRLRCLINNF